MEEFEPIDSSKLKSFSISVTEEISPRYLLTFLRTHIENQNFLLNDNSYFYYYFHKPTLQYEVIVFDKINKKSFPKILALSQYPKSKVYTVFLLEDAFCLFIKNDLALFKKIDKVIQEDIKEYLLQRYDIEVEEFISVSKDEIDTLIQKFQKKFYQTIQKRISPFKEQKSFIYFQYFFLVTTLIFFFLLYFIYNEKNKYQIYSNNIKNTKQLELQKKLITEYKQFEKQASIKKLSFLFEVLNNLEIKVLKLDYLKGKIWIQVVHPKKEKLLQLLEVKRFTLHTKAIYFEKNLEGHILELEFVF